MSLISNVSSLFQAGRVLESWTHAQWKFSVFFFALVSQSAFLPFEANTTLQHIYEKRKKNYIIHYFSSNTTDDRKDSSVIKRYQILKHNS